MSKPRRRFPPLWLCIVLALPGALMAWLWFGHPTGDEGMRNVFVTILAMLILAIGFLWFVLFSGNPGKLRALVGVGTIVLVVGCNALFEVRGFTGAMVPEFAFRFAEPEALPVPALESAPTVDLVTTTPADFPGFLGPRRDATVTSALNPDWSAHPPLPAWHREIGAGWSSFAVVNGVAVTMEQRGDEAAVTAYDVETGELLWVQASSGVARGSP